MDSPEPEPEPEPESEGQPVLECRICGEEAERSALCVPCGCRGGSELAHQSCVQTWITTKAASNMPADTCEVCKCAWTAGMFDIPSSFEDSDERLAIALDNMERQQMRAHLLLESAFARVCHGIPRPHDMLVLTALGPHVEGDWSPWIADMHQQSIEYAARAERRGSNRWRACCGSRTGGERRGRQPHHSSPPLVALPYLGAGRFNANTITGAAGETQLMAIVVRPAFRRRASGEPAGRPWLGDMD